MYGFGMLGWMDLVFPILFLVVFILILGLFVVTIVKGLGEWNKNNRSPRLTVEAEVVAKRTNVSSSHHHGGDTSMSHFSASTSYYVTFQVGSGDRMEFHVSGQEFGCLVEGDRGELTFQGSRYLGFSRRAEA